MKKKDIYEYIIIFLLTCIIFSFFLSGHYSTDTYNIINVGYENYAINWSLNDGRIFMFIIGIIASKLQIPIMAYVIITLLLGLVISCIAVIVLKNIIGKYKKYDNIKKEIFGLIISYITIFNFMYLENMYFVEAVVMAISILLLLKSADILVTKEKRYYIKALILAILAVYSYQGTICFYILIGIVLSIIKNQKNFKNIVIDIMKLASIVLISIVMNLISTKTIGLLLGTNQIRIGSIKNIGKNIIYILVNMDKIVTGSCGLFPNYLYMIFTILVIIASGIKLYKQKETTKITEIIFIALVALLASFVTYIMSTTSFYTGRLRFSIGATIGVMYIYLYCRTNLFEEKTIEQNILLTILAIYTIFNVYNYMSTMYEHKEVNKLEKEEALEIGKYIETYENKNNIKINQICEIIVEGASSKTFYNTKNKSVITYSAIKSNWASVGAINFYNNIKLNKKNEVTNEIKKKVLEHIENSEDEYFCIDNTLFIKQYMF